MLSHLCTRIVYIHTCPQKDEYRHMGSPSQCDGFQISASDAKIECWSKLDLKIKPFRKVLPWKLPDQPWNTACFLLIWKNYWMFSWRRLVFRGLCTKEHTWTVRIRLNVLKHTEEPNRSWNRSWGNRNGLQNFLVSLIHLAQVAKVKYCMLSDPDRLMSLGVTKILCRLIPIILRRNI